MKLIKSTVNKIISIPAQPENPYFHVVSWLFSVTILFSFIYICEITGM